ncbi:MAG TPA: Flp pilus assembly protein CpaB [Candidatus Limnocylindrales bacterium]|jgi:Flp pilus assembly protein CpaB|nr:Flp pilus assembly protein CpaB [Candidatus Limnocylindrales bacterium]
MELEYHDTSNRRRRIFIIIGVLLALVAGGAAFTVLSQAQSRPPDLPKRQVIVAARDIPARTILGTSDLTVREMADDPSLVNAVSDPTSVVGRVTAVSLSLQQPVLSNLLLSTTAGANFSILSPDETISPDSPNWRAVSVNVPDDRAVGGQLQADQRVDVIVTVQVTVEHPQPVSGRIIGDDNAEFYTDKSTKVTYQDIAVLAKNGTFYVLKVDEVVAEEISHLQAAGNASFSLVLRPEGDRRTIDTAEYGATTNRIIEDYGLPIPEIFPKP